jgi:hypothetical protein
MEMRFLLKIIGLVRAILTIPFCVVFAIVTVVVFMFSPKTVEKWNDKLGEQLEERMKKRELWRQRGLDL